MPENNWRVLYRAAVLETDVAKWELRVKAVEQAIRAVSHWTARFPAENAPRCRTR